MKSALVMSIKGIWYTFNDDVWQVTPSAPELSQFSRILTDFNEAPSGVMVIETKPEFAPSMIEKRLRSEGTVEGESRILSHKLVYAGGSTRVFYTAVPVVKWSEMFSWLSGSSSSGLVFSIETIMLALAKRYGTVVCRAGRQFRMLVTQSDQFSYFTAKAFSDEQDDLDVALNSLMDRAESQLKSNEENKSVYWCDLLAPDIDDGTHLVTQFSQRMGVQVITAPVQRIDVATGALRTAIAPMMKVASWNNALNPSSGQISLVINYFQNSIATVVALAGLCAFSVAGIWNWQIMQTQAKTEKIRLEVNAINQRTAGQEVAPSKLLAAYMPTINFLDGLSVATHSPDIYATLMDIRQAADKHVRVMRIQMVSSAGVFRIDGIPIAGQTDGALSSFLSMLRVAGYRVTAIDPGNQSQLPGFFSYSLQKNLSSHGAEQ